MRISRKTSIETRKPANRNTTPRNLPSWKSSVEPNRLRLSVRVGMNAPTAMRIVAGTRLWIRPPRPAPDRAGQRRDEVHHDRDRRDQQVEQELIAGLVRVERVRQHAPLRHEHVGREHRSEDEREGAGHVEERRQQAELRPAAASRPGMPSPDRPRSPGAGSGVVAISTTLSSGRADDGDRRERRPALVLEVRLDGDRQRQDPGGDEVEQRQRTGAGVLGASCGRGT